MGPATLNSGLAYARLAWPTNPSMKREKAGFSSSAPLFEHVILSLKKTWGLVHKLVSTHLEFYSETLRITLLQLEFFMKSVPSH